MSDKLTILGRKVTKPTGKLERFPAPPGLTRVVFECPEWYSKCPVTGQPDFGKLIIDYIPSKWCLESKSLKLYVWTYRDVGMFAEQIVDKVAKDVGRVLDPIDLTVTFEQAVRGGISLTAKARYERLGTL